MEVCYISFVQHLAKNVEYYIDVLILRYLKVDTDDVYLFSLISDDGSNLMINNQLVIDNDGLHSAQERRGDIALAAGLHSITINYFNKLGGKELFLQMGSLSEDMESIEAKDLFSKK